MTLGLLNTLYSKLCSNVGVGQNKRYGSDLSREAANEFLVHPRPLSLSESELAGQQVVEVADSSPVDAWVHYPEMAVQVTAHVRAYTERAIQIEYQHRDGSTHRVWVWRGAVSWQNHS